MRIGLVVDGDAEFRSLANLLRRIASGHQILNPVRADIQPFSPPALIARAAAPRVRILRNRGADRVVVLFDRETRPECCGAFAAEVQQRLAANTTLGPAASLSVVLKNTRYENWLIGDPAAFQSLSGLFPAQDHVAIPSTPFSADSTDGLRLIARLRGRGSYDKVRDAIRLAAAARPDVIAQNSRSFRRLLRVLGAPQYATQSRLPAP